MHCKEQVQCIMTCALAESGELLVQEEATIPLEVIRDYTRVAEGS